MEMSHIRYFLALCADRDFAQAANRCGVAQSSLTRGINALELELGEPLFKRHSRGAELTALGIFVEPYFAAIWHCVEEIRRAPRNVSALDRKLAKEIAAKLGIPLQ